MPVPPSERLNIIAHRLQLLVADAKAADLKMTAAALEFAAFLLTQDSKRR